MQPCTVVLRRQLCAALRLADRWAELYPANPRMLILVADGTEVDSKVTPTTMVINPQGAGMSRPLSSLLRLLHPASAAAMVFGPWAMAAALRHPPDGTNSDSVAVLIDVDVSLDHRLPDERSGWSSLCRESSLVVTADRCFVAGQRESLLEWQRRTVCSAPAIDFGRAPDAGTWWGTDRGMSNVELHHALIDRDGALVVPSPNPTPPRNGIGDDDSWWAQRDGVAIPTILRTLTITHLAAHLDVAAPLLAPYAPSTQRSLEQVPRDLLAGSPRDLRLHGTTSTACVAPPPPPNPFGPDPHAYRSWLAEPVTAAPYPVSRALAEIHRRRPDLHEAFADLETVWARRGLLEWATHLDVEDGRLPQWLIPGAVEPTPTLNLKLPSPALTQGVLVVGYLDAALGLGQAGRLMVSAVERAGERVATRTYRHLISASVPWRERPPGPDPMDVTIICLNGSELPRFIRSAGSSWPCCSYTVGLWFWEAERLTANMIPGFDYLDEVWVTSEFTAEAVRADAPPAMAVYVMPLGTQVPALNASRRDARASLGLPSGWLAGFSFDHGSMSVRKNPLGLIAAWCIAFAQPTIGADAPHLVVKTMNGSGHPESAQAIHDAVAQRPDITVIDATYSPAQQHQFVVALDCYVSLHRSEGYGLLMLEAMAVGTPVVATGATGNLAFMTADNSWLVPATPIRLDHTAGPYPAGSVVHEPDLVAAAALLGDLYARRHSPELAARVEQARADVRSLADGSAAANWVQHRLADIRSAV